MSVIRNYIEQQVINRPDNNTMTKSMFQKYNDQKNKSMRASVTKPPDTFSKANDRKVSTMLTNQANKQIDNQSRKALLK